MGFCGLEGCRFGDSCLDYGHEGVGSKLKDSGESNVIQNSKV